MTSWTLPEPMLSTPVSSPDLRPGWAGEPKWDGFRAAVSVDADQVVLRSRRGTEMGQAFPEITAGAQQLPDATALDGELVVWDAAGRLAFERLQNRLARRGAGAVRAAEEWPAHFVAFDLLRLSGTVTTGWPYRRRRAALESMFATRRLSAPWALCPSTTDPETVREWLSWVSVGMEGVIFKSLTDAYKPSVRGWEKYKVRETSEAIVGAVTGSLAHPRTLLLAGTTPKAASSTSAVQRPSPAQLQSPACSRPDCAAIRGRAGRSPPGGPAGSNWTSRWCSPTWWWKSASMSPVTPQAGGAILRAGTAPAPTSPPPTFPPDGVTT
ncbi:MULTISPECIES: ATP-dependent DNA ligase [unclassified Streptomyces]|uniref:ATP-dependent DNA ligase n=1 Tax=unclassified Streptomyces TaxID=2593676 RepID=UPI0028FD6D56|nr:ATP-dependent DNA ligase [Streptomyces sp. PAL114]MDU0299859.1 ATP-dependent DNA ligase [Streptomyces sp. PAL114]